MLTSRSAASALLALAIIVLISGGVGYALGSGAIHDPRMSDVKVFREVQAGVGDAVMSASVDGITYGANGEIPWVDATGSWHGNGWPDCAPYRTTERITFGGALIYGPTGVGEYRILWVDCRK